MNPYCDGHEIESLRSEAGIDLPHYVEWLDSSVAPEFINANVRTLSGDDAFDIIAGKRLQLASEKANQCANAGVRRVNATYRPLYEGGWWVSGLDPLNNWEPMKWGQLKPNTPRWNAQKGRCIKYEAPADEPTRLFFPVVTWPIAQRVIERHNAGCDPAQRIDEMTATMLMHSMTWERDAFWRFVIERPEISVILTEGAKKTGAAMSAGFVAIGFPGVWNGRKPWLKDADGKKIDGQKAALKDELLMFAQPRRKLVFAFDQDSKRSTKRKVWKAIEATAFLFVKDTKAAPHIASWSPDDGKGIDDFISNKGADAFANAIALAFDYEGWKIGAQISAQFTREPDLVVNQRVINIDLSTLPKEGLIAIIAPKGTGKTQHFLKLLAERADRLLLVGHLINLTKANSLRMGATYRTDVDRGAGYFIDGEGNPVYKLSTVIDSLMTFQARDFAGATLILDEVCQLMRCALTSTNIASRGNRGAILTRLRQIIQAAKLIVCADADLNDWALEYLEALRGDGKRAFIVANEYIPNGYNVTSYEGSKPDACISGALDAYKAELSKGVKGRHVFIASDGQGTVQKIAKNARKIEGAEVIEIHSETSGGELEREFIERPDQYLSYLDKPALVIYSPSIGTGVSIEGQNIASVWGIFTGKSVTDTDVLQMLGRVRISCERHVWIARKGGAYSKYSKSSKASEIKAALKLRTDAITAQVRHSLTETAYSGLLGFEWDTDPHIESYCRIEAERNRCMPNFRSRVLHRLKSEGNTIVMRNQWDDVAMGNALKEAREQLKQEDADAVEKAPEIGPTQAALLSAKADLSTDERLQLRRYRLSDFYVAEATAALVLADKKGERRSQIRAFEQLHDETIAADADKGVIEAQQKWGEMSPQDLSASLLAARVRRFLKLDEWVARSDTWRSDCAELKKFKKIACAPQNAQAIKTALGYTVRDDVSGQKLLSELLTQVGVRCVSKKKRSKGESFRLYSIDQESKSSVEEVSGRRQKRRESLATAEVGTHSKVTTPPTI